MSSRQDRRTQERNARREAALAEAAAKAQRRRLVVVLVVVGLLVAATVVAVSQATSEDEAAPTTAAPGTSSTTRPGEPTPVAEVPLPEPGEVADGTCPPEDGSGPRRTGWPAPPPVCIATTADGAIDTEVDYRAVLHTDAGDLTFFLNTGQSPVAVNDFVTMARSGYLDGAPIDTNTADSWFEFGGRFAGSDAVGAGFTRPTEAPEIGSLANPLALGLVSTNPTDPGSTTFVGGRFLVVTGMNGAALPERTTFFGILLDGGELYPRILRAGTQSGVPGEVITIESVSVEPIADD